MIDFSRISQRRLFGKLLRWPLRFIPQGATLPVLQGELRGSKWIVASGNHGYWIGSYELKKRRTFENTVEAGSVVFDVGAHVGFYTLLASSLVGDEGKVIAFEPNSINLSYLKQHLDLNHVNNVTLIPAAVSDSRGEVFFVEGENNNFTGHISDTGDTTVSAVSLDELYMEDRLPAPDYIKIDVEGAELKALMGARLILAECRPTIFLSTHDDELHKECCKSLREMGYQLQSLGDQSLDQSDEILAVSESRDK